MLAATLNGARSDLKTVLTIEVIAHAVLMVAQVSEYIMESRLASDLGLQVLDKGEDLPLPEEIEVLFGPVFGQVRALGVEDFGSLPDVGGGMVASCLVSE